MIRKIFLVLAVLALVLTTAMPAFAAHHKKGGGGGKAKSQQQAQQRDNDDDNGNGNGNGGGGGGADKGKGANKPPTTTTTTTTTTLTTALVAPTISLLTPTTGTHFRSTLKATAAATDDGTVDHVEFWLDSKRFGYDTAAPYAAALSTEKVKAGAHTLVTRAVDDQGLAGTLGTAVQRVAGASNASSKVVQAASTASETATTLLANGPKSSTVAVGLTACGDRHAKIIKKLTVKVGKSGHAGRSIAIGRLCVASVALRK
ncbi:MAG TPA: Ig-like domain-containing protein [Baekduia sp.]|nr:Ig-like domain-containing protein [Baekduia sp.]